MVRDTLDLQGDEDLEAALEATFDIRFTDAELRSMVTVGAIHDVINVRIPSRSGACETSMAFYRLRRGLIELGMSGPIAPATALPQTFLERTNKQFRALSGTTGLRLPPTDAGPLLVGCFGFSLLALALIIVVQTLNMPILGWLAAATFVSALVLGKLDRGRLPKRLSTVGDLARQTSTLNFGRLVAEGSRVNSSLTWDALREVISDATDIEPADIGRETLIYRPRKAVA